MDCVFCKIIERRVPATFVYEDPTVVAIDDLHPQASVHLLVVPRRHLESLAAVTAEDEPVLGHLIAVAARLARERGLDTRGYRTVINTGAGAGQSVFHLHVHLMGGRVFHWPPG